MRTSGTSRFLLSLLGGLAAGLAPADATPTDATPTDADPVDATPTDADADPTVEVDDDPTVEVDNLFGDLGDLVDEGMDLVGEVFDALKDGRIDAGEAGRMVEEVADALDALGGTKLAKRKAGFGVGVRVMAAALHRAAVEIPGLAQLDE